MQKTITRPTVRCALKSIPALTLSLSLAACGAAGGEPPTETEYDPTKGINLDPASFEEAQISLDKLDTADPADPRTLEALDKLQARLDGLNHLVARVAPITGYVVSFYETDPGAITIAEVRPIGAAPILTPEDFAGSAVELYQRLAGGAEPPLSLIQAKQREVTARTMSTPEGTAVAPDRNVVSSLDTPPSLLEAEGLGQIKQAWSSADATFWQNDICFTGGDFFDCLPNWANGGFAQSNAKTSFFDAANFDANLSNIITLRWQRSGSTLFTTSLTRGNSIRLMKRSTDYPTCWCSPICACSDFEFNVQTHRWDILDATGDSFHWTFSFKRNCSYVSCLTSPPR